MLRQVDSNPVAGQGASDWANRSAPAEGAVHRGRAWAQQAITSPVPRRDTGTLSQIFCSPEVA